MEPLGWRAGVDQWVDVEVRWIMGTGGARVVLHPCFVLPVVR